MGGESPHHSLILCLTRLFQRNTSRTGYDRVLHINESVKRKHLHRLHSCPDSCHLVSIISVSPSKLEEEVKKMWCNGLARSMKSTYRTLTLQYLHVANYPPPLLPPTHTPRQLFLILFRQRAAMSVPSCGPETCSPNRCRCSPSR